MPIHDVYEGLRSYQARDVLRANERELALFYEPRLGKTRVVTRSILRWTREFGCRRHLIVGPLTPLSITWVRELQAAGFDRPSVGGGPEGFLVPLLAQPTRHRGDILLELIHGVAGDRPVVVLINDEALDARSAYGVRGGVKRIVDLLREWAPESMTMDESHRYTSAGSGRSQRMRQLARFVPIKRILTGTPDPNGYIGLFSQYAILAPEALGTEKKRFVERYCDADMRGKVIYGYRNTEELLGRIAPLTSIVRASDHFDVPPSETIDRRVELPPRARLKYKRLRDERVLEIPEDDIQIDGSHALARLTRLQQIAAGYLPNAHGDPVWLHDAKIDAVASEVGEPLASGQKVIVSYRWRPEGERIARVLSARYGKNAVRELHGGTTDRGEVIAPFDIDQPESKSAARILVVQEKTGGVGISFARADHIIFATWSMDFADVDQMRKRIWHPEKRRMTETYVVASGTVDVFARAVIRRKASATLMAREIGYAAAARGDVPGEITA